MKYIINCCLLGYLIGSISPSAFISKIKRTNLKEHGTGNLGASNALLVFGKAYGAIVMIFDIAKAIVAVKLAEYLFPTLSIAGILAGNAAVFGHVFPFYLKFKGGKGLATFGGFILAADPMLFCILLIISGTLMLIANYSAAMPMSASFLFPILYGLKKWSFISAISVLPASILVIAKHFSNLEKGKRGEDIKIRQFIKNGLNK